MNITLTKDMVASLRAQALQAQNDAEMRMLAARDSYKTAENEFNAAKARYNSTLSIREGSHVVFDMGAGVKAVLRDENDPRPEGWQAWNSYLVSSRTGGRSHQITSDGPVTMSSTNFVCSCKGYTNRKRCWAVDMIRRGIGYDRYSNSYGTDEQGMKRLITIVKKGSPLMAPEFGLPR